MDLFGYEPPKKLKTAHQSLVEAIIKVAGDEIPYRRWLGRVNQSRLTPDQILNLVDKAEKLPKKYSKSGYIFKRLF